MRIIIVAATVVACWAITFAYFLPMLFIASACFLYFRLLSSGINLDEDNEIFSDSRLATSLVAFSFAAILTRYVYIEKILDDVVLSEAGGGVRVAMFGLVSGVCCGVSTVTTFQALHFLRSKRGSNERRS
jgi:hypothetical protein